MKKQMTARGVGPMFTLLSVIYAAVIFVIHFIWLPHLSLPLPRFITLALGILLVAIGLPVFILPGMKIDRYFNQGKLATEGVYAFFRHPIYGSWIVFILPGVAFIIDSLLALTIPLFVYGVFRVLISEEEKYLEQKFGDEYFEYKRRVGSIFPKFKSLWRK